MSPVTPPLARRGDEPFLQRPRPVRRILFLAPQPFFQDRGTPIAERALLEVLAARGHEVDVLTYHEGRDVQIPNCTLYRIPKVPGTRGVRPGMSSKKLVCDAVMLAKAFALARRRPYDLVHAVEEAAFIASALRSAFGIPYVYDMDSSLAQQLLEAFPGFAPLRGVLERSERLAIDRSLGVLAVCRSLESIALGCDPGKLVARVEDVSLLNGDGGGTERLNETIGADGPLVLYVGNLEPYQGVDLLLKGFALAAAEVPAAHLVVIGGASGHVEAYRARAHELGVSDRAHFLGPRPLEQLGWFLRQACVLASPRTKGHNTPMKVYSYLDAGAPVIATRLPTHTQVLDDDIAFLVDPDPEAFATGLRHLLRDSARRDRLARNARERVQQEFTPAAFDRKVNRFYDAIEERLAGKQPHIDINPTPTQSTPWRKIA